MKKAKPRVGRPPGPHDETLGRLMPVALSLFLDEGGAALTPTRLHQETGIARATIYRNWPDPADLIEIMLGHATVLPPDDVFSGDLANDLQVAMDLLIDRFNTRPARAFFGACLEYGRTSDRVAAAADAFVVGILEPFRLVIAAAIEAGTLQGDEHDLLMEVAGPAMLEHVVMGQKVSKKRGKALVSRFLEHNSH